MELIQSLADSKIAWLKPFQEVYQNNRNDKRNNNFKILTVGNFPKENILKSKWKRDELD